VPESVMSDFWASLELGPGSTVGMMRDDGWLVARFPQAKEPQNLGNYVLFTELLKSSPTGVYETRSPVDGMDRIVGYRKVPNAPLVVVASVSRSFALAQLQEQMWRLALFLVPLLIGLAALASWVAKLLKRDEMMRQSLSAAVERNNLLMREIHHRIKNNLQSVASLVKLQPISDEAKAAMSARIGAMSAVHEQAYRSDLYSEVNLREYLQLLIGNISKSASGNIELDLQLIDATIDRDLAQPLGLVVNEVISNAMKHAFEGRYTGRIVVSLAMIGEDKAELVIHDNGKGHDPAALSSSGMGSKLIRAFAQQLGNDYDYADDNGTRFSIRFAARGHQQAG
jgi:two-component sensor histidine kinase